ncbi:MAG: hypothetical protein JNK73_01650 [Bacteroidia bacterium]|nr:hypothetical protein [Bacteroidia bacterium]
MTINKTMLIVPALASFLFFELYLKEDKLSVDQVPVTEKPFLSENSAVFMSGCQTYPRPVKPKVIYPTVRTNFVTRLCALEVFPSNKAIAVQRSHKEHGPFWK